MKTSDDFQTFSYSLYLTQFAIYFYSSKQAVEQMNQELIIIWLALTQISTDISLEDLLFCKC